VQAAAAACSDDAQKQLHATLAARLEQHLQRLRAAREA
jgi:hypothetical protein